MIIVMPNAYNSFKGSMYSSSVTIGDWETFVTQELVTYIDTHYRTLADKSSRGLAGHSMGGYGTIRLAMKYPEVFSSIYLLSPCCMGSNVNDNAGLIKNTTPVTSKEQLEEQPFFVSATLATAAAWAPNPKKAPLYLDLPFNPHYAVENPLHNLTIENQIIRLNYLKTKVVIFNVRSYV